MRLREISFDIERPYIFETAYHGGRVLIIDGKYRIDVSGNGHPDTTKVYRDADRPDTLMVLTMDRSWQSVNFDVYDVENTAILATRHTCHDEWRDTDFLVPVRSVYLSGIAGEPGDDERFRALLDRDAWELFQFKTALTPHTIARRLASYIDETGS